MCVYIYIWAFFNFFANLEITYVKNISLMKRATFLCQHIGMVCALCAEILRLNSVSVGFSEGLKFETWCAGSLP